MSAVRPKEVRAEDTHLLSQRIQSPLKSDVQEAGCPLFGPLLSPALPRDTGWRMSQSGSLSHTKEENTGLFSVFEGPSTGRRPVWPGSYARWSDRSILPIRGSRGSDLCTFRKGSLLLSHWFCTPSFLVRRHPMQMSPGNP